MPAARDHGKNHAPTPQSTSSDQADLDAMNGSIDRMRTFTPTDPYVLTIPQDIEPRYHHAYQYQASQWLHQAPFQGKEGEMTQYQSFIYHEHGKDMYVLHKSRSKEEADGPVAKVKASTGANTPSAGPKKKISLDAYKKKQTPAGTPAQEVAPAVKRADAPAKQAAVKGPVERVKAETEEVLAAVAEDEVEPPPAQAKPERKELKRKREDIVMHDEKLSDAPTASEEPAAKRARTSPTPPSPPTVKPAETAPLQPAEPVKPAEKPSTPPPPTSEDTGLPPRLSPLQVPSLPTRLSPTIPANMAATLKAREHLRSSSSDTSAPSSATKNGKLTPAKKPDGITKHKSPIPRNAFRANSSSPAVRSDVEEKARPAATSAPQRAKSPELSQDDEVAVGKALKAKTHDKSSLIVKLKYKKQQRDDIRRILNMRSRPKSSATPQPAASATPAPAAKTVDEPKADKPSIRRRDPNAKGVAQKVGPAKKKVVEKAPTAEKRLPPAKPSNVSTYVSDNGRITGAATVESSADRQAPVDLQPSTSLNPPAKRKAEDAATEPEAKEPPTKRKKVPDAIETKHDPSTPAQPDLLSPALISSTQKSQQVTPIVRKDHLSVAMQREHSADSSANTPSAKSSNTPMANGAHTLQPNGIVKPPSSQLSTRTAKQQAWDTEQKRLETLGRELKHAATAHLKSLNITHSDASAPSNEQKLAAVKSVESLLAYILAFTCADEAALAADPRQNPSIKTWRSLLGFFNFVKRNCESFPLLLGLTCQLGVVFNARIIDIMLQYPAERPAGRDITMETYAALSKNAADAEAKLDVDVLQESFPRSWKARAKGPLGVDKLAGPADFAGEYKFPIGVQTPPLRAARAGYAMLEEWIGKERVGYEMKLKL
ncbi:hypothetical protein LTR85_006647 [Meristemomyces frigidus]|nr:hypothetical protein LTR85_006647 [Meristemomyces frigidus]